jgi:hypothetical protein
VAEVAFLPRRLRVLHALLPRHELLLAPAVLHEQAEPALSFLLPLFARLRGNVHDNRLLSPVCAGMVFIRWRRGRGGGGGDSHGAKVLWLRDRSAAATRGAKLKPSWVNS